MPRAPASYLTPFSAAFAALVTLACGATAPAASDAAAPLDPPEGGAPVSDAAPETAPDAADAAPVDKAARCAATFGSALTAGFGRVDGTVEAVVQPKDTQCPLPNNDHVILQVKMLGAVYRMVVNVQSDRAGADIRVSFLELPVKLPAPVWAEGWHTNVKLDYVTMLGAKSADFAPYGLSELSAKLADILPLDAKVSVYSSTSSGGGSSHLIHRNDGATDGAIVLDADGAQPRALLFRFATQSF